MARSNKYASLNFNDIYEKKVSPNTHNKQQSPSSSPSINNKTIISNSRIHGNMLVLSRPTPKPISHQLPQPLSSPSPPPSPSPQQDQIRSEKPDSISLRPLGHTGSSSPSLVQSSALTSPVLLGKDKDLLASSSPKSNRFVPPHLRPGFAGREEKPAVPGVRPAVVNRQGNFVSPSPYNGEEARPKSGGGYERMRRGFEPDPAVIVNRPGSSGARLSSTG